MADVSVLLLLSFNVCCAVMYAFHNIVISHGQLHCGRRANGNRKLSLLTYGFGRQR